MMTTHFQVSFGVFLPMHYKNQKKHTKKQQQQVNQQQKSIGQYVLHSQILLEHII